MKILVIEDDLSAQQMLEGYLRKLDPDIVYFGAKTSEEARRVFKENVPFDAIAIDGCLKDGNPDTTPLVKEIRGMFPGLIIAISGNPNTNELLLRAGCSMAIIKTDVKDIVESLLNKNGSAK